MYEHTKRPKIKSHTFTTLEKHRYSVYILRCADGSYYTGVSNDLERRFYEHQSGHNPQSYTHTRRPLELVFHTEFNQIEDAIAFEKQLKGWSRKKKEAIISGNWSGLKPLAECLNKTSHKNYIEAGFDRRAAPSAHPDSTSGANSDNTSTPLSVTNAEPPVNLSGRGPLRRTGPVVEDRSASTKNL